MESALITLREAGDDDAAFLRTLYLRVHAADFPGLAPAQVQGLLELQYRARCSSYSQQFPDARELLILEEGEPVGMVLKQTAGGWLRIVDLAVDPSAQGRGVGTQVLRETQNEAQAAGLGVRLSVRVGNPALELYERLGFEVLGREGPYVELSWGAGQDAPG